MPSRQPSWREHVITIRPRLVCAHCYCRSKQASNTEERERERERERGKTLEVSCRTDVRAHVKHAPMAEAGEGMVGGNCVIMNTHPDRTL